MSDSPREGLFEVVFESCGRFKAGDVTFGYNLSPTEEGFKYLLDNGVIKPSKAKSESLLSVPIAIAQPEWEALNEKVKTLEITVAKLEDEKAEWEALAADPAIKKLIDAKAKPNPGT